MTDKKKYQKLDEPGFVGTQDRKSATQVKKDIEQTIQLVKQRKRVASKRKKAAITKAN